MAIPTDIFSGEEFEMNPPSEVWSISHELSDEEVDFSYETPRLILEFEEDQLQDLEFAEERNWFFMLTGLRDFASIMFRQGVSAHENVHYSGRKVIGRSFFFHNNMKSKMEKI